MMQYTKNKEFMPNAHGTWNEFEQANTHQLKHLNTHAKKLNEGCLNISVAAVPFVYLFSQLKVIQVSRPSRVFMVRNVLRLSFFLHRYVALRNSSIPSGKPSCSKIWRTWSISFSSRLSCWPPDAISFTVSKMSLTQSSKLALFFFCGLSTTWSLVRLLDD